MTTATSRLLRTIQDYRERLLQRESQAVSVLERNHAYTIAQYITPKLNKLYADIQKKYDELRAQREPGDTTPLDVPPSWIIERIRLEGLQLLISDKIDQFGALALSQTRMLQYFGLNLGLQSAQQQLRDVIPSQVKAAFGVPSQKALANLVGATQKGSPLEELFRGYGAEAADGAIKALVSGVTMGENPRTIAPRVMQALGTSRNRALVISRQESLRCYRVGALETYRQNSDVVGQWRWTCAKQARTCIACIMMDGTLHDLSEEFAGHVQDRCTPVPVTKDWDELLSGLGIDTSSIPDTRPHIETGEEWFLRQNEETQRIIFNNNSMYETWKDEKFDLKDVVAYEHDPEWGTSVKVRPLKDLVK